MAQSAHPPQFSDIEVEAFHSKLVGDNPNLQLIDVREPQEISIACLPKFKAFPLSQFRTWETTIQTQLDPHAETYVLCHHGIRSAQMCAWLIQQGFTDVTNIAGGIDAYSIRVDESIPRY